MLLDINSDITECLIIFTSSLIVCSIIYKWYKERNYPPGPAGYPLIGHINLGKLPHKTFSKLSKQYGDIFSLYIGPKLHIVISDYHLAKEILTNPLMLYRPPHSFDFVMGKGGIFGMNGEEWSEQRRFCMFTMRNLGLGKGLWETLIHEKAADFVEELASSKGQPTKIDESLSFNQAANEVSLIFGRLLDKEKDAEDISLILKSSKEIDSTSATVGIIASVPWLAKVMEKIPIFPKYHRFISFLRQFENIFRKELDFRMKSDDAYTKDDFIGSYLQEMKKREEDSKPHSFNKENLLGNLLIFFLAGNDSTLAGVSWLFLLMASYQDIQKKVHDEIDKNIGRDGIIYYDEKAKFPYTMATVNEMLRWPSISTIFPPRYALETFTFNGYTIPQGAHVIVNIRGIMQDPRYFENPEEFNPERFLSKDGEKVIKLDGYAPFSLGKRNCPGEGVAIMSIFLYFVCIMQKFKIEMPPGTKIDLEPSNNELFPKPQHLCFLER